MQDFTMNPTDQNEPDDLLDRELALMGHFSPSADFEDSIMSQVMLPAPRWVQSLARRRRKLIETGKIWWLLGGFAGTSAVSISIVVTLVTVNSAAVAAFVGTAFQNVGIPAWRATLGLIAAIARDIYAATGSVAVSLSALLASGAILATGIAINALVLYKLMHHHGAAGTELNAIQ